MEKLKKSNKIFLWGTILAITSLLLCYVFVVLYFFYISPNNISIKFSLWPFLDDKTIAQMYLDATVDIEVSGEESFVGVNVKEDGVIVAPYHNLRDCESAEIKILSNSGKVFQGDLIFAEPNFDLAILKCKNFENDAAEVAIPYVKVPQSSYELGKGNDVLLLSSPRQHKFWKGSVSTAVADFALTRNIDNFVGVDVVLNDCQTISVQGASSFKNGAVFDLFGNFLGFSYEDGKDEKDNYVICSASNLDLFLEDALKAEKSGTKFEKPITKQFVGLDTTELDFHKNVSKGENGREKFFYFQDQWQEYTDELDLFYSSGVEGIFLLEDFEYDGNQLGKGSIITNLKMNGKTYDIKNKNDLIFALYKAKNGQNIEIHYFIFPDTQPKRLSFTL